MGKIAGEIEKIIKLQGECQKRWTEYTPMGRPIANMCGHPRPCSKHEDVEKWRKDLALALEAYILDRKPKIDIDRHEDDISSFEAGRRYGHQEWQDNLGGK